MPVKKGVKEKVIEMTLNSSNVRDIGRVLGISKANAKWGDKFVLFTTILQSVH